MFSFLDFRKQAQENHWNEFCDFLSLSSLPGYNCFLHSEEPRNKSQSVAELRQVISVRWREPENAKVSSRNNETVYNKKKSNPKMFK
jgi:hypothetical protein